MTMKTTIVGTTLGVLILLTGCQQQSTQDEIDQRKAEEAKAAQEAEITRTFNEMKSKEEVRQKAVDMCWDAVRNGEMKGGCEGPKPPDLKAKDEAESNARVIEEVCPKSEGKAPEDRPKICR